MALVSDLLQQVKPSSWTNVSYTNVRFVKITLSEDSNEYREVLADFKNSFPFQVISITRIQHPFAFCRFKLRQRQLLLNGTTAQEKRIFFRLTSDDNIEQVLEYNCDQRRDNTFAALSFCPKRSKYVIAVKKLSCCDFNQRDSHRYPEYLIECDITNCNDTTFDESSISSLLRGLTLNF